MVDILAFLELLWQNLLYIVRFGCIEEYANIPKEVRTSH